MAPEGSTLCPCSGLVAITSDRSTHGRDTCIFTETDPLRLREVPHMTIACSTKTHDPDRGTTLQIWYSLPGRGSSLHMVSHLPARATLQSDIPGTFRDSRQVAKDEIGAHSDIFTQRFLPMIKGLISQSILNPNAEPALQIDQLIDQPDKCLELLEWGFKCHEVLSELTSSEAVPSPEAGQQGTAWAARTGKEGRRRWTYDWDEATQTWSDPEETSPGAAPFSGDLLSLEEIEDLFK